MDITAALAADLTSLTQALDDPDADVARTLHDLAADARLAVSSYLGLSVRAAAGGEPFEFSVFDDLVPARAILASLLLPLTVAGDPAIAVILYAGIAGAFVDLAADLTWLTGYSADAFVLDQHLGGPAPVDGPSPLSRMSTVNQAVGILITRGFTLEQARAEIDAAARRTARDSHEIAQEIVSSLGLPPADGRPGVL